MSLGGFLAPLLYPTVGLALFMVWGFARLWHERGQRKKALGARAFVIAVACAPMAWTLNLIRESLGWRVAVGHGLVFGCFCAFLLLCLWLRSQLDRREARGSS